MNLTAIHSLETARRKLFMNATYIMSRKLESNVFGHRGQNESKVPKALPNQREENFS